MVDTADSTVQYERDSDWPIVVRSLLTAGITRPPVIKVLGSSHFRLAGGTNLPPVLRLSTLTTRPVRGSFTWQDRLRKQSCGGNNHGSHLRTSACRREQELFIIMLFSIANLKFSNGTFRSQRASTCSLDVRLMSLLTSSIRVDFNHCTTKHKLMQWRQAFYPFCKPSEVQIHAQNAKPRGLTPPSPPHNALGIQKEQHSSHCRRRSWISGPFLAAVTWSRS